MPLLTRFALLGALFCSSSLTYAQTVVTPLSPTPARVLGPSGLRREVGRWLFNDSVFVATGDNFAAPNTPTFIPNLRRDKKSKLPRFMPTATRGPLNWATLGLPTLRQMTTPGFDFVGLQAQLTSQVNAARAQGQVFVGWSLPTGNQMTIAALPALDKTIGALILKKLRTTLDAVAPDSALILDVNCASANPLVAVADLDAAAPSCDAVLLHVDVSDDAELWPLKMARRTVEEQPNFDLPIFVMPTEVPSRLANLSATNSVASEGRMLQFFMGGATGFIMQPSAPVPAWENVVRRDKGFFSGAVTLEDSAVLPSQNPQTLQIVNELRTVGRIPLVGRLPVGDGRGEPLLVVLDDQTTLDTLTSIERAARAGSTIYLEGTPNLQNTELLNKLSDMVSVSTTVLPTPRTDVLQFDDPWLFGTARGLEFPVLQRVKWTIKTTLAGQTRVKKGVDSTLPSSAARLTGDDNGLLFSPLGKGRIIWLAHTPQLTDASSPARRAYLSAIAGLIQASLVTWKWPSMEAEVRGGAKICVALRASPKGTPIVALWNDADTDANLALSARGDAPLALDLNTEKEIPAMVVDYSSNLNVTVPAHGWTWLAFGTTRKDLDKER